MTDLFPPQHLDLERLEANLAANRDQLLQVETIIIELDPGTDPGPWRDETGRLIEEAVELEKLIATKKEYDRGRQRAN